MGTNYKPLYSDESGVRYTFDGFIEKDGAKLRRMTPEEEMDYLTMRILRTE